MLTRVEWTEARDKGAVAISRALMNDLDKERPKHEKSAAMTQEKWLRVRESMAVSLLRISDYDSYAAKLPKDVRAIMGE